jgi:hypothetical protein
MDNFREIFSSLRWRLVIAIPLFAVFVKLVLFAPSEGGLSDAGPLFAGMACLVLGAIVLCPPLARLIAEPAGWLFYSTRPITHGQPTYEAFEALLAAGKHEEAIACLEKLAGTYPDEVRPHVEMLQISMLKLHDPERTEQLYLRGMQMLRKREAAITQLYVRMKAETSSPGIDQPRQT